MASRSPHLLDIPVFAGQGTAAASSHQSRQQACQDASSSSGAILLSACHQAFHTELSTLTPTHLARLGINLADFRSKDAILAMPMDCYLRNPIISNTTLLLIQVLRYLSFIEEYGHSKNSPTPFTDILQRNSEHGVGILGFSSGIMAACVVGTSSSTAQYIDHAVEAYRLALWIGIRLKDCGQTALQDDSTSTLYNEPWGMIFDGMDQTKMTEVVAAFNKEFEEPPVFITAIMKPTCVTVSGRPDALLALSKRLPAVVAVYKTALDALYNAPIHNHGIRTQILSDVASRGITFPTYSDITVPIRSTHTGEVISNINGFSSLLEIVVDMVVTQPVNWDLTVANVRRSLPPDCVSTFLSFGPGLELTRSMESLFDPGQVFICDATTSKSAGHRRSKSAQQAIAIVGMGLKMPGASSVSDLWKTLEQGLNSITQVPEHRFEVSDYNGAQNKTSMKEHSGNFIDGADEFDNKFFKISPREAKSMDPQQRILLHTAYEALEDSGYVPNTTSTWNPETFGCFIGTATHDYLQNLRNDIDVYYSTGTLKAFLSGRISYAMQLSGPSIVVDTASSSSNVALYQGARALMNGDCNAALVGGVDIISSPDMFMGLDRAQFLSPTGQCKAFDASADVYSRSEGCGVFVLKRLADAIAENDNIWGVIRGVEVNQSGLAHSITHPHALTQAQLFERLLANADVEADRINVVEAHGTGIPTGDPNELNSIRNIFGKRSFLENPLHITSANANIGHLGAASGAAGLAKLLLMLKHKVIPRQISLTTLNSSITHSTSDNTIIATTTTAWSPSHYRASRLAMLNNFGAAGSNTAVLLEEAPSTRPHAMHEAISHFVVGLSAKDHDALEALRLRYLRFLQGPDSTTTLLADFAYTSTARRQIYDYRISFSVRSKEDLIKKLETAAIVRTPKGIARVAFVYTSQGSQYLGIGLHLYNTSPLFKRHIDECQAILLSFGFPGVIPTILTGVDCDDLSVNTDDEALHVAVFSIQYALTKLWLSWGLEPVAIIGHSFGEFAALVAAKVLTLKAALYIVAKRARLTVRRWGTAELGTFASQVVFKAPTLPILLGALGKFVLPGDASVVAADYFARHCEEPAEFVTAIRAFFMESSSATYNIGLGLGPLPASLSTFALIPNEDGARKTMFLSSLAQGEGPWCTLTGALSQLYLANANLIWRQVFADLESVSCVSLPSYPFSKSSFWVPYQDSEPSPDVVIPVGGDVVPQPSCTPFSILHSWAQYPSPANAFTAIFETPIEHLASAIVGHRVGGIPLCPASVYLEQAFAAIELTTTHLDIPVDNLHIVLRDINFERPLVYDDTVNCTVVTSITMNNMFGRFSVCSRTNGSTEMLVHAHGHYRYQSTSHTSLKLSRSLPLIARHVEAILHPKTRGQGSEVFSTRTAYQVIFPRVVDYAKEYHTIQTLTVDGSGMEGCARIRLPRNHDRGKFFVHPVFTDTLLHVAGFVANLQGIVSDAYICIEVGSVKVLADLIDYDAPYDVYISNVWVAETGVMLAEAFAMEVGGLKRVVAHMKDMKFRRLRLSSVRKMLENACTSNIKPKRLDKVHLTNIPSQSPPASTATQLPDLPYHRLPATHQSHLHSEVFRIVSEASDVGMDNIDSQVHLAHLGVDSLMSIEIFSKLEQAFPDAGLSQHGLSFCQTIGDIIREISKKTTASVDYSDQTASSSPSTQAMSGASSPRTLVSDEVLAEPIPFSVDGEPDMKGILAAVLDISTKEILEDMDFQSLGLDSLTSIEALQALKSQFGLELPVDIFATHPTIRAFQTYLTALTQASTELSDSPAAQPPLVTKPKADQFAHTRLSKIGKALRLDMIPVPLQKSSRSDRLPLFLIHDGSGLTNYYDRLSPLDRTTWGIHNPHFLTSEPWDNVVHMATAYAQYVRSTTAGPIILGGWSFGGIAAYETALQLAKQGVIVKGILLIDSPSPIDHVPLSDSLIESVVNLDARSAASELAKLVKTQFAMNARMLGRYNPHSSGGTCPPLVMLRSSEGYNPPGVPDVPVWLSNRHDVGLATTGWDTLSSKPIEVFDIPGHHFQPFHPSNISDVSLRIIDACEHLESL